MAAGGGESRGGEQTAAGVNHSTWGLMSLRERVTLLCLGKERPRRPGLVASGTLSPPSQPCGNRGSASVESLLRFRAMALHLRLSPTPVNRDPPSKYKDRSEDGLPVVRSHVVMGYLSMPWYLLNRGKM